MGDWIFITLILHSQNGQRPSFSKDHKDSICPISSPFSLGFLKFTKIIKPIVVEFWEIHSHAIWYKKHVLWQHLSRGVYVDHAKHTLEMKKDALFKEFLESSPLAKITISTFQKLKPSFIRHNTIYDTCCCQYHIEFQLHYDTFLEFYNKHWQGDPTPTIVCDFVSSIYCA